MKLKHLFRGAGLLALTNGSALSQEASPQLWIDTPYYLNHETSDACNMNFQQLDTQVYLYAEYLVTTIFNHFSEDNIDHFKDGYEKREELTHLFAEWDTLNVEAKRLLIAQIDSLDHLKNQIEIQTHGKSINAYCQRGSSYEISI